MASEPNDNGAPTWQDALREQTYGVAETVEPIKVETKDEEKVTR